MSEEKSFFFCPYSPGILVTHPDVPLDMIQAKSYNRRSGRDRRINKQRSRERRTMNIPVCPAYEHDDCSYKRYPAFRSNPSQLLALCHSKAIARFLDKSTGHSSK